MPTFLHVGCGCRGHHCFDLWALASKGERTEEEMRRLAAEHFPK